MVLDVGERKYWNWNAMNATLICRHITLLISGYALRTRPSLSIRGPITFPPVLFRLQSLQVVGVICPT